MGKPTFTQLLVARQEAEIAVAASRNADKAWDEALAAARFAIDTVRLARANSIAATKDAVKKVETFKKMSLDYISR